MSTPIPVQRFLIPGDDNTRAYFSRAELVKKPTQGVIRGQHTREPVIECLLQIPGVALVAATTYNLTVVKAPVFSWQEIEPAILNLLTSLNTGEGKLFTESPVELTNTFLSTSEDLGGGFQLAFQTSTKSGQIRAIVKRNGVIVARGSAVEPERAIVTRLEAMDALLAYAKNPATPPPPL